MKRHFVSIHSLSAGPMWMRLFSAFCLPTPSKAQRPLLFSVPLVTTLQVSSLPSRHVTRLRNPERSDVLELTTHIKSAAPLAQLTAAGFADF